MFTCINIKFVFVSGPKINFVSLHERGSWLAILWREGRVRWREGRARCVPGMTTPFLSELSSYPHHHVLHTPIVAMQFLHCLLLLGLAHHLAEKRRGRLKHSRYWKDFFKPSLLKRDVMLSKILQCSLIPLKLLPWQKLLASRNDQECITMLGFDCKSFDKVEEEQ